MKKTIVLMLGLVLMGSAAFGLNMTFGGGMMFNHSVTKADARLWYDEYYDYSRSVWVDEYMDAELSMSRNGFGGFIFFGFNQYTELNLGFLYKNPKKIEVSAEGTSVTLDVSSYLDGVAALQVGLYLKYPFPVSDMLVLFPTGGVDAEFSLGGNDLGFEWWHDFWIRAGLGMDVFFNERTFLRAHFIYGVGIPFGGGITDIYGEESLDFKISHGPLIKVGIGVMF